MPRMRAVLARPDDGGTGAGLFAGGKVAGEDAPVEIPETKYAWNGGTALAYQVAGSSGPDLLFVPGSVTHLEVLWDEPRVRRIFTRLTGFSRLILMDPRGLGLSDRLTEVPTMDERVADLISVLDAAGSGTATLFGNADTGPACIAAAVLHPDRVSGLILFGTYAKGSWSEDYPIGWTEEEWADFRRFVKDDWGTTKLIENTAPSLAHDEAFRQWYATLGRLGASPRAVLLLGEMTFSVDVRPLLPQIAVPSLVMHRVGDRVNSVEHGRYLAERIPGARWVQLPGDDFILWSGDTDAFIDEVEEFLTGRRDGAEATRVVATVMFTDVVGSTERAGALGDRALADLLEVHHARVRAELGRFGGREIDTAGDGFLASFDSPASAINCSRMVLGSLREIGVELRIGLHTGECDVVGEKLRGIAIHIGARICALAGPSEIVVSQTVKDLVAGSGLAFEDAGEHELKGVPDRWHLYRVVAQAS
jgi:class 3 adenylate cyclase